jgi:hypothetical protein
LLHFLPRWWSQDDVEQLKAMAGNYSREKIASQLKRGPSAVAVKAHQLGISLRRKGFSDHGLGTRGSRDTASQREPGQPVRSR